MFPREFVAEVYRRMHLLNPPAPGDEKLLSIDEYWARNPYLWAHVTLNYRDRLPPELDAAILDVGCGSGHFLAACVKWGYKNLAAMDYIVHVEQFRHWGIQEYYTVTKNLPASLGKLKGRFDVIHAAHLIEHIPKHDLIENVDAMFYALRPGGRLIIETPNMLSPPAMASLFVTLGHEYGFSQHNLCSLLNLCGFRDERAEAARLPVLSLKAMAGELFRNLILLATSLKYRLFGWTGAILTQNIIVAGVRPAVDPLPDRSIDTANVDFHQR